MYAWNSGKHLGGRHRLKVISILVVAKIMRVDMRLASNLCLSILDYFQVSTLPLFYLLFLKFSSVQFSPSVMSDSLRPHEPQHARLPCPSATPKACSNTCPSNQWCHPTVSSSVIPFFSCLQSFPASGSFPMSQFFASGGQSIGVSGLASILLMNIQDWFPLRLTTLISLESKGLSRVFSNTTVQKHQFSAQPSLWSNSHVHTWLLEKP